MRAGVAVLALLVAAACRPATPLRLEAERGAAGRSVRFRLVAAPGARINARLKPALEVENGALLRFDSPHLTRDSAYFTDAPSVAAALPEEAQRGVLRASVCSSGENVCRSFELAVRW